MDLKNYLQLIMLDSSTSFSISEQGDLSNDQYIIIRRNLLKVNSNTFSNLVKYKFKMFKIYTN
jgi:hypothetical protein